VLPKLVMRVEPDEKFIEALDHELRSLLAVSGGWDNV